MCSPLLQICKETLGAVTRNKKQPQLLKKVKNVKEFKVFAWQGLYISCLWIKWSFYTHYITPQWFSCFKYVPFKSLEVLNVIKCIIYAFPQFLQFSRVLYLVPLISFNIKYLMFTISDTGPHFLPRQATYLQNIHNYKCFIISA